VRELVASAFERIGHDWERHVKVDESLKRGAAELHDLVRDAAKARSKVGWSSSLDFTALVHLLVDADLERLGAAQAASVPGPLTMANTVFDPLRRRSRSSISGPACA